MDRIIIIDDDGIKKDLNGFLEANQKNVRLNSDIIELSSGKNSLLKEIINRYENKLKLKIKAREHVYIFKVKDIMYIEGLMKKTVIYLADGGSIKIEGYLDSIAENFKDFPFLNVHPDYIININYLTEISEENDPCIILGKDVTVPLSQYHKKSIIKELQKYI